MCEVHISYGFLAIIIVLFELKPEGGLDRDHPFELNHFTEEEHET